MNEVMKCPKCGGELEQGFIRAPRGIYWDKTEHTGSVFASEALISMWSWSWTVPSVEAWRCGKCNLAVFLYKQRVKPGLGKKRE